MEIRRISREEMQAWYTDQGLSGLDEAMLDEMEAEGIIFEMRSVQIADGKTIEAPFINADNWMQTVTE